ncbi:MAG TPA: alpha-ketoglutarate-dependent dioxygenase AlkB [Polyangium sp.]|nr:alpha-ketoglutarate-dependent dioxygenase AlkB [Polyangium sp.]
MLPIDEHPETTFLPGFLSPDDATALFAALCREITWDESIKARKTACFGQTYDDSGIHYVVVPMHPLLEPVCEQVARTLGFRPTNCLANYYESGRSTMGFHSDAIHNLAEGTGVAIVSLGAERELVFRSKINPDVNVKVALPHGSLLYMTQLTQRHWKHAVKKTNAEGARISLTFRHILPPAASV